MRATSFPNVIPSQQSGSISRSCSFSVRLDSKQRIYMSSLTFRSQKWSYFNIHITTFCQHLPPMWGPQWAQLPEFISKYQERSFPVELCYRCIALPVAAPQGPDFEKGWNCLKYGLPLSQSKASKCSTVCRRVSALASRREELILLDMCSFFWRFY